MKGIFCFSKIFSFLCVMLYTGKLAAATQMYCKNQCISANSLYYIVNTVFLLHIIIFCERDLYIYNFFKLCLTNIPLYLYGC